MHSRIVAVILLVPAAISAAKPLLYIDKRTTSTTPLECFQYDPATTYLCVAAGQSAPENQFAVAGGTMFADGGFNALIGLTPPKVSVNGQAAVDSPLHGQKINHLRFVPFASKPTPVVISEQAPNIIHFIVNPTQLISSATAQDARGNEAERIISLATGPANSGNAFLIAAVQPKDGPFGSDGSGISAILLTQRDTGPTFTFTQLPTKLDLTSDQIKINHNLATVLNAVDIHWDLQINRFYIALQAEAGEQSDAGVRSIVVGRFVQDGIRLDPIIPTSAIDEHKNQIVAAMGASSITAIEKLRTMHTSTRLSYLIVAGGVGHPDETNGSIYALPIVDYHVLNKRSYDANPTQGTVATTTALPKDRYSSNYPYALLNRGLTEPATLPEELLTAQDAAAAVGGGPINLLPGQRIKDLIIYRDTVYAVTPSCMLASQALFDAHGRIKNWTQWHIVMRSKDEIINATIDINEGFNGTARASRCISLTKSDDGQYAVQFGAWELTTQHPILKQLNALFPPADGGITHLATSKDGLLALNRQKLAVAHGDLVEEIPSNYIAAIAPLTTATSCDQLNPDAERIIFVGGAHGLVAIKSCGQTWIERSPLGTCTHHLKTIGAYSHVRSLATDAQYLYILTNNIFDRISLADMEQLFNNDQAPPVVTLATPTMLGEPRGSLFDAKVSYKLGLLATSFGLFRVGSGKDISDIQISAPDDLAWTIVDLPNGARFKNEGPVRQLLPISPTNNPNDFACNGMLYVLAQGAGESSRVYRLSIGDAQHFPINDDTVLPLNDCFIKNEPSYLIEFGGRRSFIATDGAVIFDAEQQGGNMQLFQYGSPIAADTYGQRKNNRIFSSYGSIHMPVRLNTGEFIIPTSAGLIVYE